MITIERKILNVKIQNVYFANGEFENDSTAQVKAFSHSFVPKKNLRTLETLQFDLTKDDNELLMAMQKTTRRQIRRAEEQELDHIIIENPTDHDLVEFQNFYNQFAKNKKTHTCNSFHMKTMKLLREKNALLLTYIKSEDQVFCYRVYILDGTLAMNLYSASHFRMADSPELKRLLGQANRYLVWLCILFLKEKGYKLYDMGGLSYDENIRRFKLGFGGEIVPVYWGYEANSIIGALVLQIRNWKMAWATAREIQ
ncbi:hypothetical protein JSQ81_07080 [Sporosarcina sp. Marseille-Q4063]|uniref:GNAT family N-acetyltransferase n=1 Tax=Sporosarcina sp. Marseille-Q4063 TaxID=2810514 RepID=UPI001BB0B730|nr:GNAT family N-acetyltransferase [Sporosarcina sp. Marseille-Q4063]QUW23291.1 hypothetical protein JSQ81_07080 [Sporosarcina sp. Marseille-Q4063]